MILQELWAFISFAIVHIEMADPEARAHSCAAGVRRPSGTQAGDPSGARRANNHRLSSREK